MTYEESVVILTLQELQLEFGPTFSGSIFDTQTLSSTAISAHHKKVKEIKKEKGIKITKIINGISIQTYYR
jgi:hypothetical protein